MLRLLLDEHITPDVAVEMRRADPQVHVESLAEWQDGRYMGLSDDVILSAAQRDGRTLVTYDQVTIVPLLVALAERDEHHGGVVLLSHGTIRQNDVGTLARALVTLWRAQHGYRWADRCVYVNS